MCCGDGCRRNLTKHCLAGWTKSLDRHCDCSPTEKFDISAKALDARVAGDNWRMPHLLLAGLLSGSLLLQACSPSLNWRDVRLDQTPVLALFPCKPERAAREVSMGDQTLTLTLLACDAGDAKFALAYADTKDADKTGPLLALWRSITLDNMRATAPQDVPVNIKGVTGSSATGVLANGSHPDGTAVVLQAVWFASGSRIFQASVYSDVARSQVAETYFAGLRLP